MKCHVCGAENRITPIEGGAVSHCPIDPLHNMSKEMAIKFKIIKNC